MDKNEAGGIYNVDNSSVNSMWIINVGTRRKKIILRDISKEPKIREISNRIFAFKRKSYTTE